MFRRLLPRPLVAMSAMLSLCLVMTGCRLHHHDDPVDSASSGNPAGAGGATSLAFLVSGAGACGGTPAGCNDDSFQFTYGNLGGGSSGGSGGGSSGAGAGGGESAMLNVTVTAYKPDGTTLGQADLQDNLVSIYPGTYTGPFILKFVGNAGALYFDESTKSWEPFDGKVLHVMVPSLSHHISANPLTEAAYQYALQTYTAEANLTAAYMSAANEVVRTQFNATLPTAYQSEDVTNFTTPISDKSGLGTLGNTKAGRFAAVLAGMPIAATRFNSSLVAPAIAFGNQLAADIVDDGILNASSPVTKSPTTGAYSVTTLPQYLQAGVCTAVATWGSNILPSPNPGAAGQGATGSIPGQLTLLAGSAGGVGACDGWGSTARFFRPMGTATDSAGNIYVADTFNNIIRRITPDGAVTTFAGTPGTGNDGSQDGTGAAAQFSGPEGITVDASGNVYVADTGNSVIRKITPAGVVTTLAGYPQQKGSVDGPGSLARFKSPQGIVADPAGNLYVADVDDHTIRRVSSLGVVTTWAGQPGVNGSVDASGTYALFDGPSAITIDKSGTLYVAEVNNNIIRRILPDLTVTTLAGKAGTTGAADGLGSAASFNGPQGIVWDVSGNIYVADTGNNTLRVVSPSGSVTTLAGQAGVVGSTNGNGAAATFQTPAGMADDGAGNLYVADSSNDTIRKFNVSGSVTTLAGLAANVGSGRSLSLGFMAADSSGNVYATDQQNYAVLKITPAGVITTLAGASGSKGFVDGPASSARFGTLWGIALDAGGNLYVADQDNYALRKVSASGQVSTLAGGTFGCADGSGAQAQFGIVEGVAVDTAGNVYVVDNHCNAIRKVTPDGTVSTLAGQGSDGAGSADGTGTAAQFNSPVGITIDTSGNLFVTDFGSTIRKVTPDGTVTTIAGQYQVYGSQDGPAATASFWNLAGITVDSTGNLYVADQQNGLVRKVSTDGQVSTVVGVRGSFGTQLGPLPASLSTPRSVLLLSDKVLAIGEVQGILLATFP